MAKVKIKGIPWLYETRSMNAYPKEGDYIHLPNDKYFVITSNFIPYEVQEVMREDIPIGGKRIFFLKESK